MSERSPEDVVASACQQSAYETTPAFSVIVPTYNRPSELAACLQALCELDYPRECFEVVVVDDGSAVSLREIIERFSDKLSLLFVRQIRAGPAAARNAGARQAKGQYLALTDDDCEPAKDWLTCLQRHLARDPSQMYGGRVVNGLSSNRYAATSQAMLEVAYAWQSKATGFPQFFATNNLAVSADLFRQVGGFSEAFQTSAAEDREFCDRWVHRGHAMVYVPDAVIYHHHNLSFWRLLRQQFQYGCGAFRFYSLRSERGWGRFHFHGSFYRDLLRYSLEKPLVERTSLIGLLSCAQLAVAAGFYWRKIVGDRT